MYRLLRSHDSDASEVTASTQAHRAVRPSDYLSCGGGGGRVDEGGATDKGRDDDGASVARAPPSLIYRRSVCMQTQGEIRRSRAGHVVVVVRPDNRHPAD